jgi:hypothetical protein
LVLGLIFMDGRSVAGMIKYWPEKFIKAWRASTVIKRAIVSSLVLLFLIGLILLLLPYARASNVYEFTRSWDEVSKMLPRVTSYLIADFSKIYLPLAYFSLDLLEHRNEHQLFIGLPALFLLLLSLTPVYKTKYRKKIRLYLGVILFLIFLTLNFRGYSFYKLLFFLPGIHSIRAVTRLILVLLWPISLIIAIVLDSLLKTESKKGKASMIALLFLGIMMLESSLYNHSTFSIDEARSRIQKLQQQIPTQLPEDPILFVWNPSDHKPYIIEMDALLLAQDRGWPVLNAYSGNFPQGYGFTHDFDQAVVRIFRALAFRNELELTAYTNLITRVVPIGPIDAQWPAEVPNLSVTYFPGPFQEELFSNIHIKIESVYRQNGYVCVEISIKNNSSITLPAESSTGNPFRISWRIIDRENRPVTGFDRRKEIYSDILPGSSISMTIIIEPDFPEGHYVVEVSALQEQVAWFHDRGLIPARAAVSGIYEPINNQ